MAIIKTYPLKSNYYGPDRLILSDMQPDSLGVVHGTTKSLTLSSLKSFIGSGSSSFTLVVDRTSGAATFDTNTKILNIPDYSIANPVDGSGTAGRIPKWSDSNTLGNSQIFQSASSIGIGTVNPTGSLEVYNGALNNQLFITCPDTSQAAINFGGISAKTKGKINYSDNSDVMMFHVNSSERMRITSTGNVGIGTTSPTKKLDVNGDVTFGTGNKFQTVVNAIEGLGENAVFLRSALSSAANPSFSNSDDQNTGMFLPGSDVVGFTTNASEKMRITSTGNIGIGTTAPTAGLQVKIGTVATPADYAAFLANDTARFNSNHSNEYGIGIGYVNATTDTFGMQSGTTSVVKPLSLNPFGGNVGIGTTSPSAKLDVAGSMNVRGIATLKGDGTNDGKLRFNCSANTHYVEIVGPTHSGGSSYSLKLPNSLPSVSNQILEANALGTLSWIPTPSGGGGGGGTLNTVGITMPPAFSVGNSPLTGTGGSISIGVTGGSSGQFLAYNGQWATPSAGTTSVTNGNPPASTGSALTISPNTGAVIVTSNRYAGTNKVGHVPAGGTGTTFLRGDGTWATPTAALDFFKTIATPTNNVVASGNSDTLTLAAGGNTGIFINGSGSQVTIGLYAPTALALGGIKLSSSAATTDLTATYQTATAGTGINNRVYPVQLNSANQAGVYVPWTGGSGGISFSGTTSGGLATYTNSSIAGVSSKVTLNASGLMDFDADGNSAGSIDYDASGTRLKIGDLSTGYSGIVEIFTNGNRQFQIGVNGEIGIGTGASQGTNGQVLTSQGNGSQVLWTNKTTIPSNNVTGSGTTYDIPMWNILPNPQAGIAGSYLGPNTGTGGFASSPFKSNASGQSIISTEVYGGIPFRNGTGAVVTINGGLGTGAPYTLRLPSATASATGKVLGVTGLSSGITSTAWVSQSGGTTYTAGSGITINSGNEIINADKGSSQFIYKNIAASTGGTATANSNNDTLTIAAGSGVTTTRSGDTITVAATGSGSYEDGFVPLDIYASTGQVGNLTGGFSYMRQTLTTNSAVINRIDFFVTSIGTNIYTPEISFALFDSANLKNSLGTCRAVASSSTLTAGVINTMSFTDGEGSALDYTCVPGKQLVLFFAFKNMQIAGGAALGNTNIGIEQDSIVAAPTADDTLSSTKNAFGDAVTNTKIIACHFYKA